MSLILPNVILAGVQKGGTTAVYDWLAQHPDIYADRALKDFPFFCEEGYWGKGLDWFSDMFSGYANQQIILHGYVNYLFLGSQSAHFIAETLPGVKIFAILRNPIHRAHSAYLQAKKMGREPAATFEQALKFESSSNNLSFMRRMDSAYIEHGLYSEKIRAFRDVFGPDNIRFYIFEDLENRPYEVCRELFEFFGIDSDFNPVLTRQNPHGVPRSTLLQRIMNNGIYSEWIRDLIPIGQRIKFRRYVNAKNMLETEKPVLKKETVANLKIVYADEIEILEKLLDRDLSIWKN